MSKTIVIDGTEHYLKTNGHERELFSLDRLPEKDQADFAYIKGEDRYSTRLFQYRGSWYDTGEFTVAPDSIKRLGFDGVQAESYFSAVLARYFDEDGRIFDDAVIVGYLHW